MANQLNFNQYIQQISHEGQLKYIFKNINFFVQATYVLWHGITQRDLMRPMSPGYMVF